MDEKWKPTESLKQVSETEFSPELDTFITSVVDGYNRSRPNPEGMRGGDRWIIKRKKGADEWTQQKAGVFDPDAVMHDVASLENNLFDILKTDESDERDVSGSREIKQKGKRLSDFMEAAIIAYGKRIFPGDNVEVVPASQFADVRQGVDAVVVVRDSEGKISQTLALDFTYAESEEELKAKLESVARGVVQGTLSSARYITIGDKNYELGMMPKLVVPFSNRSVIAAGEALRRGKVGRLKETSQISDFLGLAQSQIDLQICLAESAGESRYRSWPPYGYNNDDTAAGRPAQKRDVLGRLKEARAYLSQVSAPSPSIARHRDAALNMLRKLVVDDVEKTRVELLSSVQEKLDRKSQQNTDVSTGQPGSPDPVAGAAALPTGEGGGEGSSDAERIAALVAALEEQNVRARKILEQPLPGAGGAGGEPPKEPPKEPPAGGGEGEPKPGKATEADDAAVTAAKKKLEEAKKRLEELEVLNKAIHENEKLEKELRKKIEEQEKKHGKDDHGHKGEHKKHDAHGHGHHEPWHFPRNASEWGWLAAAVGIGAWNLLTGAWKYLLQPIIHSIGYVITGDEKAPWTKLWSNIGDGFKKFFGFKGGGGGGHAKASHGHGGGGHGGGGHGH